jgi:hypothetical protein
MGLKGYGLWVNLIRRAAPHPGAGAPSPASASSSDASESVSEL